jgi:hypothetical protein
MTTRDKGITLPFKNIAVDPTQAPYNAKGDGVTDDTSAIQAAHDAVVSLGGGTLAITKKFKCNSGLSINPGFVTVQGPGGFDFSGMVSGAFITFVQTVTDANLRHSYNNSHPFVGITFYGTGYGAAFVTAVKIQDNNPIAGTPWIPGINFLYCTFLNCYRDIEIGNGAFFVQSVGCVYNINGGSNYDTSIYVPAATNAGEGINFSLCRFGKVIGSILRNLNVNSFVAFSECHADYTSNILDVQGGTVVWDGYLESNADTNYWFKLSGSNTQTFLRVSGTIVCTGNKSSYEMFYCDPAITAGGLDIDCNINFSGGALYTKKLIAGTGKQRFRQRGTGQSVVHPAVGGSTNYLYNGGFEVADLSEFTLVGATTLPTRSTTRSRTGSYSLKLVGQSTTTFASFSVPLFQGQMFHGELWYWLDTFAGTGATFYVTFSYLNAGGQQISGGAPLALANTNASSWNQLIISTQVAAPPGTRSLSYSIQIFGVASGTPTAYIDDIDVTVSN